ncbi:hypothetical protein DFS34DRAFT_385940 [Phlyctochytrium arcticum]|nr:hypothetical protein DFS34DRAFT_385940 [Phlyctochytrium arcticum]
MAEGSGLDPSSASSNSAPSISPLQKPVSDLTDAGLHSEEVEEFHDCVEEIILSPEERRALKERASSIKNEGNELFKKQEYDNAMARYEEALATCPKDEAEDRAVYQANIAACYMQQSTVAFCTEALKGNPTYIKALSRRASANEKIGSWASLTDALKDYQKIQSLGAADATVKRALSSLPGRITVQQEKEKDEMLGKLKDLGNGILGKFGLSLDNFNMQKDPKTGSYSMNMGSK